MHKRIYLDHNATTPVSHQVLETMLPYFKEYFGNASSIHSFGKEAKQALEKARGHVAELINCEHSEIVFTSGGTESDNFAVFGIVKANRSKGNHIITSQIEHHAILNPCKVLEREGYEVTYLPVDEYGIVNLNELKAAIKDTTILISIMAANNEIGTIQPLEEIGSIASTNGIFFHSDAVQAAGKIPLDVKKLKIDMASLSSHKIYGPKGVGALYVRKGIKIFPLQYGGHHEHNKRAGTENISGIVGFGKACELAKINMDKDNKYLLNLREKLYNGITENITDVSINGHPKKCLSGTISLSFKYIEGESILLNLNDIGIAASSGSACTSGSLEPSHVLLALGISPLNAHGSIRFSIGRENTEEEIDYVIEHLPKIVKKLRNMSPLNKNV
ncbi:MAG: cysteine desulfurase NifS [Candidatus Firestonebacteria bacterium]|nr:cysteine desulfurase NifS [Candidatus Firestonebacteria bacterium]